MFQRRSRKFKRRSNGRHHYSRMNDGKNRFRPNLFVSDKPRNFNTGQNAEKLFEKYSALAKEALSSGDKTLSENYLQHADHFMRLIADKKDLQNNNTNQNSSQVNLVKDNQEKNTDSNSEENNNIEKK